MVNIEDLLGKVANNGATLQGILAHGEWNTLVQAVRELQGLVASDDISDFKEKIKEIQQYLQIFIENGLLVPGSMEFDAIATSVTLKYKLRNSDGTDTPYAVTVPIATSEKAGMMSAEDKELLTNAGKSIDTITESLKNEIKTRMTADEKHDNYIAELQKEIWPVTVTLNVSPNIVEVGVSTNITLTWAVMRKGNDVSDESEMTLNGEKTYSTKENITVNENLAKTISYTLEALYDNIIASETKLVSVVYPSYYGDVPADWVLAETSVKALTKSLQASRAYTHSGINMSNGKICYCYPTSFGLLTSIKDGNGYEVIDSYTRTTLEIDGMSYLCYVLTNAVSVDNVTQIYR